MNLNKPNGPGVAVAHHVERGLDCSSPCRRLLHVILRRGAFVHLVAKTRIIDIVVVSGASVAKARDDHYHDPPDYLVVEPGDTSARTGNLQQTNTAGYKFQGTPVEFQQAQALVRSWGRDGAAYSPLPDYQAKVRELIARFTYRLDTNFAKMDRIVHGEIEDFKSRVCATQLHGRTIEKWNKLLSRGQEDEIRMALAQRFGIGDDGDALIE